MKHISFFIFKIFIFKIKKILRKKCFFINLTRGDILRSIIIVWIGGGEIIYETDLSFFFFKWIIFNMHESKQFCLSIL